MKNARALAYASYAFLALGIIKLLMVAGAGSLIAYANSFDFIRQSSCVGLWQHYGDRDKTSGHPHAPLNALVFDGDKKPEFCMRSIDNAFPYLAALPHSLGVRVDFREVGAWKALLVVAIAVLIAFGTFAPGERLAMAVAFFLVFGDLANLLYINTLYLEFSVVLGTFVGMLVITYVVCADRRPRGLMLSLGMLAVIWLGCSKQQYMPLACVFSLMMAATLAWRWRSLAPALVFVGVAVLVPVVYGMLNSASSGFMQAINMANKTDTYLTAVLPAATDKNAALAQLGLPQSCAKGIGMSWYSPGLQQNHPCPEVGEVSRLRLLKLFVRDPATFFGPLYKGVLEVWPLQSPDLGHLENRRRAGTLKYASLAASSLSVWIGGRGLYTYIGICCLSMLCGVLWPIAWLRSRRTVEAGAGNARLTLAMIGMGGIVSCYAIASSVFGDGYSEVEKHAVVFVVGIAFQLSGLVAATVVWVLRCARPRGTTAGEA